ncbi:hypothetical protein N7510_001031 [Penicillium lagena]|uniref:uncharacterized protein n=1 Tax=Penicillium lagena TaxID=94218 RepID=UPI00253FEF5F|nr:uncharacterized protein N7510_001031 [Penicillium lagena]KAJ5624722.1 hypothetical protein N7510_001031 [Penicillium lagena]
MGIPYLTKHLLPYADPVVLGVSDSECPSVQDVVIDGPSLVYQVYLRLLAWSEPSTDVLAVQPTCHQVSIGVLGYLLQLAKLGVQVHGICFDGALPMSKREIRLARLEKSRHRLELFRRTDLRSSGSESCGEASIQSAQLWRSRSVPTRWKNIPENPFMVSAVYEDLLCRWTKGSIADLHGELPCHLADFGEHPWADITVMAPGEADAMCAFVSKQTGAAILTNDSDLLLHDLGPHGSVVFLDSVHMPGATWEMVESDIQGLRLCPHSLAGRLGMPSVQRFAYELKKNPHLHLPELIRKSKDDLGAQSLPNSYHEFLQEYQHDLGLSSSRTGKFLDPRVSELFWQYELPETYCTMDQPHVYLGILNEDHARRCAWEEGRFYRSLGYSLFNLSRPSSNRFTVVCEYVRRGGRIVADQITLAGAKTVDSDLDLLRKRLSLARSVFGNGLSPLSFWALFALSDIYQHTSASSTAPSAASLERFLVRGFMAQRAEWVDHHLLAQIQAVLYSLRILRQLLEMTTRDSSTKSLLADLPPLHILARSRHEMVGSFSDQDLVHRLVGCMFHTYC